MDAREKGRNVRECKRRGKWKGRRKECEGVEKERKMERKKVESKCRANAEETCGENKGRRGMT